MRKTLYYKQEKRSMKHTTKIGKERMHSINIRLYPSYLPGHEEAFVARTVNDASLGIEEVCTSLIKRGGFTGEYNDIVNYVKQYFNEVMYQICDGYTINTGYFSIYPNVGGTFSNEHDKPDPKKNPLSLRFQPNKALKEIIKSIRIVNQGLAKYSGYITEYIDTNERAVNDIYVPGNVFILKGSKIKVIGDDSECGVYFVSEDDPSREIKAAGIIENNPSKIIGVTPAIDERCRVEVRTRFANSSAVTLKKVRSITSKFVLKAA